MSRTGASPELWTITGRPDTTALSYLLARAAADAAGLLCQGEGWPLDSVAAAECCPRVMSAPRRAEELVPGSPEALRRCADAWRGWASGLPSPAVDPAAAACGYVALADEVEQLKRRAESRYAEAAALGVGEVLLCDGHAVRARMEQDPSTARRIARTVRAAIDIRLGWIDAHQGFISAISEVGAGLDLSWPEPAYFRGSSSSSR